MPGVSLDPVRDPTEATKTPPPPEKDASSESQQVLNMGA